MRARDVAFFTILFLICAATGAGAQPRCWDMGGYVRCQPGCELVRPPRFPGDHYTWRCLRPPPPPRYIPAPPPDSCPQGTYPVTEIWCCPFGTVYRNGTCQYPQRPRVYEASGPEDPTATLMIVAVIAAVILAWFDRHTRQAAYARESADAFDDVDDIAATAARMQDAADRADEILRQFRTKTGDDA